MTGSINSDILYYKCVKCRDKISLTQINNILWDNISEIERIVDDSFSTFYDVSTPSADLYYGDFNSGGAAQIVNYTLPNSICSCQTPHSIALNVFFLATTPDLRNGRYTTYLESIDDIIPLNSRTLVFSIDFALLQGAEILKIIYYLFERWVILGFNIEIFCPYLSIDVCWDPLLEILSTFKASYENVEAISIYTRYRQEWNKLSIQQQIKKWINKVNLDTQCFKSYDEGYDDLAPCEEDPYYPCAHNFGRLLTSSIYTTKTRFHGKYYLGYKDNNAEILITSFNLISAEINQFETMKLDTNTNFNINTTRPNLNWLKYQIDSSLIYNPPVHDFINPIKIKKYIKSKGLRISTELLYGSALNCKIQDLINKAIERTIKNKRRDVQSYDI